MNRLAAGRGPKFFKKSARLSGLNAAGCSKVNQLLVVIGVMRL